MQVKEIMTRNVECISPSTTVSEAAVRMKSLDVGPLPVCDNDRLRGMLTDRDIVTRVIAEKKDPAQTKAGDVMTSEVIYCYEDDEVADAARKMRDAQVRRILVLSTDKRLCGIVSLGDLSVETGDAEVAGNTLEGVSQPAEPKRS